LFYVVTAAVPAGGFFHVMLRDGQSLRECFLAGAADEIVVGHTNLPQCLDVHDCGPVAGAGSNFTVCLPGSQFDVQRTLLTYGAGDRKDSCDRLLPQKLSQQQGLLAGQ
jgi:hypothetical protein